MKKYTTDFTVGSVTPALIKFATPLFLTSLLQVCYGMVDMIIVGQTLGDVGLSGVAIGGDVSNLLAFVAIGFAAAGQVIISQLVGSGRRDKVSGFIGTMFTTMTLAALAFTIIGLFCQDTLLQLMNTPKESYAEASGYSRICILGMVFIYGYNMVSAVLRGMGDSTRPLIFIGISSVVNIILDVLFVIVWGMGAEGAAYATIISQAVSFIICVVFIYVKRERYGLEFHARDLMINGEQLSRLVKLGVPMGIKFAAIHTSRLFVNSFINSYGVTVSAFAGVAHQMNSVSNLVSNAFNTAGSTMVAQNVGAKKYHRIPRILYTVGVITCTIAAIFTTVTLAMPDLVFGLFTSDKSVIEVGYIYLPVAVLIFFGSSLRAVANALINGTGNTGMNFATAILDGLVLRIGLSLLFGLALNMGALGFWLGDAVAGLTPFVIGAVFYFTGAWKREKTPKEQEQEPELNSEID